MALWWARAKRAYRSRGVVGAFAVQIDALQRLEMADGVDAEIFVDLAGFLDYRLAADGQRLARRLRAARL